MKCGVSCSFAKEREPLMNRTRIVSFTFLAALVAVPVACSESSVTIPADDAGTTPTTTATTTTTTPTTTTTTTGSSVPDSGPKKDCEKPGDCSSNICLPDGKCAVASITDNVQNNDETDIDCGGIGGKKCVDGKKCLTRLDCTSAVCKDTGDGQGLRCQAPSPTDLTRNGTESDIDCGGVIAPKCAEGLKCGDPGDCASGVCVAGLCKAPAIDGVKNGTETDVDCGGPTAPACIVGKTCGTGTDCTSKVCTGGTCKAPSPTDNVKNGTETDVDCGGAGNPKCTTAKSCVANGDCASAGCAYNFKCAPRPSCTPRNGGDTCGRGEIGQAGATHESCCATAPVPGMPNSNLGKYGVTAGRMRVFLNAVGGNVRAFVKGERDAGRIPAEASVPAQWDPYLPTSFDGNTDATELAEGSQNDPTPIPGVYTSVYRQLGGFIFRNNTQTQTGCYVNVKGTHTYWMSKDVQQRFMNDQEMEYGQDVYDAKGLNCVNYIMAQAFCIWDGGRLQSSAEFNAAWGASTYPWGASPTVKGQESGTYAGNRFPTATDASLRAAGNPLYAPGAGETVEFANFRYSYEYPNLKVNDYVVFIGAPGRLQGRSANGHSMNDGLMEITSIAAPGASIPFSNTFLWAKNGSFEGHGIGAVHSSHAVNKYGKLGMRCVYPTP